MAHVRNGSTLPANLLTIEDVAKTLHVSERTVRELIKRGELATIQRAPRCAVRIDPVDLAEYVARNRRQREGGSDG
jgi:excisionase family DNA binding protein